ncbi:MAG: mucoidy inhibitor MuiA family protein [Spirochaetales bacterium]|nr:mucoidy inhibitor MuiA family protein [Spirochaetales bacterium]
MAEILYDREKIQLTPNSTIRNITIFPGYSLVEREQNVHLTTGEQTVEFTGIGGACIADTVKAKADAAGVRILSVAPEKKFLHFFNKKEHDEIYKKVKKVLRELIQLFEEQTVFTLEAQLIEDLRLYLQNALNDILLEQHIAIEKLREALDFTSGLLTSNRTGAIERRLLLEKSEDEYHRLYAEYDAVRKIDTKTTFTVKVEVAAEKECDALFLCSYMTQQVFWKASYDVHLDTASKKLSFFMYADILQRTGEDWDSVPIVISTAEADTGIIIPVLFPTVLSGSRETVSTDIVTGTEDADDFAEGAAEEPEPEEPQSPREEEIIVEKKGTAYTFRLSKPVTIKANGEYNRVLVQLFEFNPETSYETIPAVMPHVYFKASFKNNSGMPFPEGVVQVFRNGSFMGKTSTGFIADGEECSFSFGIDDDIKVRRTLRRDVYKAPKGIGGKHVREYIFDYELSHYKEVPVTVVLKEAIHLSEVAGVTVTIDDSTSRGYTLDRHGIVTFTLGLPAKKYERTKLVLAYTIDAKKKFSLEKV